VTRSAYREVLPSRLMRPFELIVALLSPAFLLAAPMTSRSALAQMAQKSGSPAGASDLAERRQR
jgi:hypothetical protein